MTESKIPKQVLAVVEICDADASSGKSQFIGKRDTIHGEMYIFQDVNHGDVQFGVREGDWTVYSGLDMQPPPRINGIYWSTYWSADGEHEIGENFADETQRSVKALEMLGKGWTVAYGDFAGLQEKMIQAAKKHDKGVWEHLTDESMPGK